MSARGTREAFLERYHTLKGREETVDPRRRAVIFESFRRTLGPWLPQDKNAAILDVGCGEGVFLSFLESLGYTNLHGFDYSPENVELCREQGLKFVGRHDALRMREYDLPQGYDAIFALDLIEHLPKDSAVPFLQQMRSRLAPGGYVVLQTPNMACVYGLFHRYDDLSHEYCLTEGSARGLLTTAGFEALTIEIRPQWNATTWLGWLREVYLRILHTVVWLADNAPRPRIPTKNLLIRAYL